MSDFWDTKKQIVKPVKKPGERFVITKQMILDAQESTQSNMEAARWLTVSYNTYKKWAKYYDIFEQHLNQSGIGIKKGWAIVGLPKKAKGYDKRWNKDGTPNYGSAVYIIGLQGDELKYFKEKWNRDFYKVGKSNNIKQRISELLNKRELGIPWKDEMWDYWGKNSDVIIPVPTRTEAEAYETEKAFHHKLKDNKVQGIVSQEMFEVSKEKIDELIKIEVIDYKSQFLILEKKIPEVMELYKYKSPIDSKKILSEWTMLVPSGMPDIKNPSHINCLMKVLKQMNMPEKVMKGLYENLTS